MGSARKGYAKQPYFSLPIYSFSDVEIEYFLALLPLIILKRLTRLILRLSSMLSNIVILIMYLSNGFHPTYMGDETRKVCRYIFTPTTIVRRHVARKYLWPINLQSFTNQLLISLSADNLLLMQMMLHLL